MSNEFPNYKYYHLNPPLSPDHLPHLVRTHFSQRPPPTPVTLLLFPPLCSFTIPKDPFPLLSLPVLYHTHSYLQLYTSLLI